MGPYDQWVSECAPCRWALFFDTEDEAIAAAEKHVAEHHFDIPPHIRGQEHMGHVQLRTMELDGNFNAVSSAPAPLIDSTAKPEGAAINASAPAHTPSIDIITAGGEHITVKE